MKQINALVPELWCRDFDQSLAFYTDVLGFEIAQRRDKALHAYLQREAAQIMLAHWEQDGTWETAEMARPFGRGINFQILTRDVQALYQAARSKGMMPFVDLYTRTYWRGDRIDTRMEFAVQDPDGYLLRFTQILSHRPITPADTNYSR